MEDYASLLKEATLSDTAAVYVIAKWRHLLLTLDILTLTLTLSLILGLPEKCTTPCFYVLRVQSMRAC